MAMTIAVGFVVDDAIVMTEDSEMERLRQRLTNVVRGDPAAADVVSAIGATGGQTIHTGRFFITLKPRNGRDVTADQIISRLRPKLAEVEGAVLFLQSAQDVHVGGRLSRTQYQYTLQDPYLTEPDTWASRVLSKLKSMPQLRDVASDEQINSATLTLTIDRDQAARFGIQPQAIDDTLYDAFGQRQVTQYFTPTNSDHVVTEVLPRSRRTSAPSTSSMPSHRRARGCRSPPSPAGRRDPSPSSPSAIRVSCRP